MPVRRPRAPHLVVLAATAALVVLPPACSTAPAPAAGAMPSAMAALPATQDDAATLVRVADALLGDSSTMVALRGRDVGGGDHELAPRIALVPRCRIDARHSVVCSAEAEPETAARARYAALTRTVAEALRERGWTASEPFEGRGFVHTQAFATAGSTARIAIRISARPEGHRVWLFAYRPSVTTAGRSGS